MSAELPTDVIETPVAPAADSPSAPEVRDAPTLPVTRTDPERVDAFIRAHDLAEWVDASVRLARECFSEVLGFRLWMSGGPGEYGETLFVEARLPKGTGDVGPQYHEYVRRYVRMAPTPVREVLNFDYRCA